MTTINRPAGQHASSLARAALIRATALFVVALGGGFWAIKALAAKPISLPMILLSALVAAGAIALARGEMTKRAKAAVGARSERRVAKAIKSLGPDYLANSLMIGAGGDADHTVIGPCLVVVETKTGHGEVRRQGGKLIAGRRTIPGDPVAQVRRQAAAVGKVTNSYCDAVVCISDGSFAPFETEHVTVCSLADLPRVLKSLPARLSSEQAGVLYQRLVDHEQRQAR